MKVNGRFLTVVVSLAIYSLLWLMIYRFGTAKKPASTKLLQNPVETTTPEQQARGERSYIIAEESQYGITRKGFFVLVVFGYIAIAAACAIAFLILSFTGHMNAPPNLRRSEVR